MTNRAVTVASERVVYENRDASRDAALFVWSLWAVMLFAALFFIKRYGNPYPYYDDWMMAPVLLGVEPVTWTWLWSQHEEHRIPLPRLLSLALLRATDMDFRAQTAFNAITLGALAVAMILTASKLRGRIHYSDAFFPLVLLSWAGPDAHLEWGFLIQLVSSTVLAGIVLVLIVRGATPLRLIPTVLAGVSLALLPLCGANGLGLVPALALWLGGAGFLQLMRDSHKDDNYAPATTACGKDQERLVREQKRSGLVALGFAALALILVPVYFIGLEKGSSPPSPSLWTSLATSVQLFSTSAYGFNTLGRIEVLWPYEGLAVVSLLVISTVTLLVTWYTNPRERQRALGLLFFVAAFCCLALGIGHGRGGYWPVGGLQTRYIVVSMPILCCIYFIWVTSNKAIGRFIQMGLLIAMCCQVLPNMTQTLAHARGRCDERMAFDEEMAAGVPVSALAQRYRLLLLPAKEPVYAELTANVMKQMHDKGVKGFRGLMPDPPHRELPGPTTPAALHKAVWEGNVAHGLSGEAYLDFFLDRPRFVYAVRLSCAYVDTSKLPATFSLSWRTIGQRDSSDPEQSLDLVLTAEGSQTVTIWINKTIDRLRIKPDEKPFACEIMQMALWVPETEGSDGDGSAVPLYSVGTRLDFTNAQCRDYLIGAWFGPEAEWQWSGPQAGVRFRLKPTQPLRLRMRAVTFGNQRVIISLNGREVSTLEQNGDRLQTIETDLPSDALAEVNTLTFTLPDARLPKDVGQLGDPRVLGLGVAWVEFVPTPESTKD